MADERADGLSGDDRGITRRTAIGTGIAAMGVGAVWASPAASASTNERLADKIRDRDPPGAANGGKVTVFNCYNEPVNGLAVGGGVVGDIAAWSGGGGSRPPKYTPASLTVSRSKKPEPKSFAIGENRLLIPWDSFTGTAKIQIPDPAQSPVSLDDDLLLFVGINEVTMMTTRGYVTARFSVERQFGN
jgi:hypothetical protein